MKKYISIITSLNSKENSEIISNEVLEKKLSPCVQRIGKIKSTYIWKNKVQNDNEFLLIIKTIKRNKKRVVEIIEKIHPYDTPEIISMDFDILSKEYEDWFNKTLKK